MIIADKYTLELFINGADFFATDAARISVIDIYEDIYSGLPTCTLELVFPKEAFDTNSFVDGSLITIGIISQEFGINSKYDFRVWDIPAIVQDGNFITVQVNGVLDVYNIYHDANKYNLYANTSDIFSKICTENNWTSDIDLTTDQQLWVAGRRNTFQFMHHLCKHGYVNETSCMYWFFDKEKRFMYKNISALFKNRSTTYTFFKGTTGGDKSFAYNQIGISLNAGTNNVNNGGYGYTYDVFDLLTYKPKEVHAKKVTAVSNVINVSKELSQGLHYDKLAMDVGNFNPNYHMAYAQNARIRSTYSTYINLSCQYLQKFRLGEIVNVEYQDIESDDTTNKSFSMLGMIDEIHVFIAPEAIGADVEIMTQGINTKSEYVETF